MTRTGTLHLRADGDVFIHVDRPGNPHPLYIDISRNTTDVDTLDEDLHGVGWRLLLGDAATVEYTFRQGVRAYQSYHSVAVIEDAPLPTSIG